MGTSFAEVLSDTVARQHRDGDEARSPSPFADSLHGWEGCVAEAAVAMVLPEWPAWARTLAVSPHATEGELRRAFRRRAFELHPDRGGDVEAFLHARQALDEGLAALGARPLASPRVVATRRKYASPARRPAVDVAVTA
jgi:hypothetical protein